MNLRIMKNYNEYKPVGEAFLPNVNKLQISCWWEAVGKAGVECSQGYKRGGVHANRSFEVGCLQMKQELVMHSSLLAFV